MVRDWPGRKLSISSALPFVNYTFGTDQAQSLHIPKPFLVFCVGDIGHQEGKRCLQRLVIPNTSTCCYRPLGVTEKYRQRMFDECTSPCVWRRPSLTVVNVCSLSVLVSAAICSSPWDFPDEFDLGLDRTDTSERLAMLAYESLLRASKATVVLILRFRLERPVLRMLTSQIHYLTPQIRCCGAGTAADTEFVTNLISSNLELHALSQGRPARVVTAMTMLKQYLYR